MFRRNEFLHFIEAACSLASSLSSAKTNRDLPSHRHGKHFTGRPFQEKKRMTCFS